MVGRICEGVCGGEVRGSNPVDSNTILQPTKNGVPRGSPRLGHVAPNYSPIKCHVSTIYSSTCPVKCLPRQLPHVSRTLSHHCMDLPHHCTALPHHCTALPRQSIRTIRTAQSASLFFPV
jgi:hypothetical protein